MSAAGSTSRTHRDDDLLQAIADCAPVPLRVSGIDGGCVFFNERWLSFTGRALADELGDGWRAGQHPDDATRCAETYRRSTEERCNFEIEYRLRRHDGEYRWVLEAGAPRFSADGEFTGFIGSCIDISDRRDAEDALLETEERLRVLTESIPHLIFTCSNSGVLTYANERWARYTGVAEPPVRTIAWHDMVHADDRAACDAAWSDAVRGRGPFETECRLRRADGEYAWHLLRLVPQRGSITESWIGSATNIDDRKRVEEALLFSEELYRSLAEAIPALVIMISAKGEVQYCNQRFLSYFGRKMDELRGAAWVELIHPDDVSRGREPFSLRVREGRPVVAEFRIRGADGYYRWHLGHTVPLRDGNGQLVAWLGALIDIDARKRAEERDRALSDANERLLLDARRTSAELRRANEAKDEFLSLVSHELRTPITTIFGNAEVLRNNWGQIGPDALHASVADIAQESARLRQMIDNMFVLARLEGGREAPVEPILVSRLAQRLAAEHRQRHPRRPLELRVPETLEPASGEPTYAEQVLRNLLSNAEKYSPYGAPIEVSAERRGHEVVVCVLDRGRGIEEGEADLVFNAFYRSPRTAGYASGAGIGLTVCKRLVEAQGGQIWARPREGGGSEFGFTLPLAEEASQ